MDSQRVSSPVPRRRLTILLAFGAILLACLCGPAGTVTPEPPRPTEPPVTEPPATEPPITEAPPTESPAPVSTWEAWQYLTFGNAWATVSSLDQENPLGSRPSPVLPGGYIKTDVMGQAEVTNGGSCHVFVFQTSGLAFDEGVISSCPKGIGAAFCSNDSTYMVRNCPGLRVSTVAGTFETQGTEYMVIEHRNPSDMTQGSALVMVLSGLVRIIPTDPTLASIDVNALQGAYIATSISPDLVNGLSFLPANTAMDLSAFTQPITEMNQVDHVQRANLLLRGDRLNMIPLTGQPYKLRLQWLNEGRETVRLSDAVTASVNWDAAMETAKMFDTPIFILEQQQAMPLTKVSAAVAEQPPEFSGLVLRPLTLTTYRPYQLDSRYEALKIAGIAPGEQKEIALLYDSTLPGAAEMAEITARQLESDKTFAVIIEAITPENAADLFAKFESSGIPTLVLGGF
jgi:hypothetical protein